MVKNNGIAKILFMPYILKENWKKETIKCYTFVVNFCNYFSYNTKWNIVLSFIVDFNRFHRLPYFTFNKIYFTFKCRWDYFFHLHSYIFHADILHSRKALVKTKQFQILKSKRVNKLLEIGRRRKINIIQYFI